MKMRAIATLLWCASIMLITACGEGKINAPVKTLSSPQMLSGIAQKGPAQPNASVILYELDYKAKRTGRKLITKTIGKQGAFAFQIPESWRDITNSSNQFAEVVFTGHFFDESTGNISTSSVQLSAFTLLNAAISNQQVAVNILTTLLHHRIKYLLFQGSSFLAAQQSAVTSLQELTGISATIALRADITRLLYPEENAVLLFLSGAIAELSQQYNIPVQRIIDQIATNFAIDGQLSGQGEQWEQRLQQMAQGQESSKTEKYSAYLQNYIGRSSELSTASHLPKQMRITTRPVADAGVDQIVPPGAIVNLSGLKSHDIDGAAVDYVWFQTDQSGNVVTLNNRFIASPQFKAPDKLNQTLWFALIVTDKNKVTDTDTVKISTAEVLPTIDDLPDVMDKKGNILKNTIQVNEGGTVAFSFFVNNPLKKGLRYSLRSLASNGTVQLPSQGTGTIAKVVASYTHNGSETQADVFEFTATDERNNSVSKRINVVIIPVNDAPVGKDDRATTFANQSVEIAVLENDTDPESDILSVIGIITQPTSGTVNFNNGIATYLANKDFIGNDRFEYKLTDGDKTAIATVFITVNKIPNSPPVANNDLATTRENQPVVINVIANDSDPDGDNLTVLIDKQANYGTVLVNTANLVIYTPVQKFSGNDNFTYILRDGRGGESKATVFIKIIPNILPDAVDDIALTNENNPVDIPVLNNDSDPDGNKADLTISTFTQGIKGSVKQKGVELRYTPDKDKTGEDSFTYTIVDKDGGSATATVKVTIKANNIPPVAVNDTATTTENEPVDIAVLLNDSDPDGNKSDLSIVSFTQGTKGKVTQTALSKLTYSPDSGKTGIDSFTYTIANKNNGSATATVTVTINALANQPPKITSPSSVNYAENGNGIVLDIQSTDDNDSEGNGLYYGITGGADKALFGISANTGKLTFNTSPDFENPTDADKNNIYDIEVTVSDSEPLTAVQAIQVKVTDVTENTAPVAIDDEYPINAPTVTGNVITDNGNDNDYDPDGDSLSVVPFSGFLNGGSFDLNADGSFIYIPIDVTGNDTFLYTLKDSYNATDTATVTFIVGP
jgi:hypothetical protein